MTDTAERSIGTRPAWAPSPNGAAFTPPSPAAARSFPSELRPAARPQDTKNAPVSEVSKKKSGKVGTVLLSILMVLLLMGAGLLIWKAFTPDSVEAPLPAAAFEQPAGGKQVGPSGDKPVQVDGKSSPMTTAAMGKDTLFIPALRVYMPIEADSKFIASRYAGFDTLRVPSNPKHGVRYAAGAAMFGGDVGTTLIASHVSSSTGWGALRYLYKLKGGEMIYTKDANGQLQTWQMNKMRVEVHTDFPQEYWSATGVRQLVLTTCGGPVAAGHYRDNIFAIAAPVNPTPAAATVQPKTAPPTAG